MIGAILASGSPLNHVVDHRYAKIGEGLSGFTVLSYHIVMEMVAALLLMWVLIRVMRRQRTDNIISELTPRGMRNALEAVCAYLRNEVAYPALQQHTDRFIPFLWSVFFFVLVCNLLGVVPLEPLTKVLPLGFAVGGTPTGNIWTTGTLSFCTLVMIVVNGLRFGGLAYLAHFCPGPLWLAPLLVPVEIIGLIAKIFALTVRLFANMIAGHILLAVLLSFIGMAGGALGALGGIAIAIPVVLGSVAINFLEIFVAFLQAFIFMFLTTIFISQAVMLHHDHEEEHEGHEKHATAHA
jgi:F-type H+-transporting ATPase subunit a